MSKKITIACDTKCLPQVREFIGGILLKNNLNGMEAHKMILAVDEICANLIIHANENDSTKLLNVTVNVTPKKVTFVIRDKGKTFDLTKYKEPTIDRIINTSRKGGLGLILVRRIMDDIEFSSEKNYNICRLIKKL